MKFSTIDTYMDTINQISGEELKIFFIKNSDLYLQKEDYLHEFGAAMDNFIAACISICNQNPDSRLSKSIKSFFDYKGMTQLFVK